MTMKIGLVGYQGSGKSTLFHWLTGVAPDPALAHTGQSAMAPIPDARFEPLLQNLPSEEGHARRHRTGRYAGPEPHARGQRHPAGHDPRGGLPGVRRGRLRRHRSGGRSPLVRRRPRAGRHGDRHQPHRAGRRAAQEAAAAPGTPAVGARARHAEDRAGGDGVGPAAARVAHDRRAAEGDPRVPAAEREAAAGDRQHGRRRIAAGAVHVAFDARSCRCWPCPPGWSWNCRR